MNAIKTRIMIIPTMIITGRKMSSDSIPDWVAAAGAVAVTPPDAGCVT